MDIANNAWRSCGFAASAASARDCASSSAFRNSARTSGSGRRVLFSAMCLSLVKKRTLRPDPEVRAQSSLFGDVLVTGQKLGLQDTQPVQFIEKVRGGANRVPQRFPWMLPDIPVDVRVGRREIEIVEVIESFRNLGGLGATSALARRRRRRRHDGHTYKESK